MNKKAKKPVDTKTKQNELTKAEFHKILNRASQPLKKSEKGKS